MKLLIAEDEQAISSSLKKSFESENFVVDVAEDGEQASYLARTNEYDLIILDNMMPKKTGLQVCQETRQDGKGTPIIMLSVQSETDMKIKLLDAGADDYVTKPYSFHELLARVKALLRRPEQVDQEVNRIDNLVLDSKRQSVKRDDKEIYLTRKEFLLLHYLLKNPGVVLSRGMIMEHVWDMNVDVFSNTIESHIRSLRKKIDTPDNRKLIHTCPGRGYKIDLVD
jgi:two-component system, OmpR family, response regulator